MKEIKIKSSMKNEMIDITNNVEELIQQEKIAEGFAILYVPHTTAGVTINEGADPDVQRDIVVNLNKLITKSGDYKHMEGNSDAHIKSSLIGPSQTVLINNKELVLGTWQHIFFYEGDGPRNRKVYVDFFKK